MWFLALVCAQIPHLARSRISTTFRPHEYDRSGCTTGVRMVVVRTDLEQNLSSLTVGWPHEISLQAIALCQTLLGLCGGDRLINSSPCACVLFSTSIVSYKTLIHSLFIHSFHSMRFNVSVHSFAVKKKCNSHLFTIARLTRPTSWPGRGGPPG